MGPMALSPDLLTPEPMGWLGALVTHGGACLSFQIDWMLGETYGAHRQILPNMSVDYDNWNDDVILKWDSAEMLTNMFVEWPCPVFPRSTPAFLLPDDLEPMHTEATGDNYRSALAMNAGFNEIALNCFWGKSAEWKSAHYDHPDHFIAVTVDEDHHLRVRGEKVHPAKRVRDWVNHIEEHKNGSEWRIGRNRQFELIEHAQDEVGASTIRAIHVPSFWRASEARVEEYYVRLQNWYRTAHWLSWAGLMLCLHARMAVPSWYRDHCVAWGIGVPSAVGVSFGTAALGVIPDGQLYIGRDPRLRILPSALHTELLHAVVRHAPPPGTNGWMGEQIAAVGEPRTLCDMPPEAGSIQPPLELLDEDGHLSWCEASVTKSKSVSSHLPWLDVVGPIIDILISVAGSFAGGAISTAAKAVTAAAGAVLGAVSYIVATVCVQTVNKLGRGNYDMSAGDVVGLIGGAVSSSGLEGAALKSVPEDLWAALKTAGAALPEIDGTDWALCSAKLQAVQESLHALQHNDGSKWAFVDAAFGGMGLSKNLQDEVAKKNLDL